MPEKHSNRYTVTFVVIICLVCATALSVLSILLSGPQEEAEELYNSQQLLIAAKLLSHDGYFTTREGDLFVHAKFTNDKLVPDKTAQKAKAVQILNLFNNRIDALLVDPQGNLVTFAAAKIDESSYMEEHQKRGFAQLKYKLIYVIKGEGATPYGYVIPINGFGLWDAIYGYICLEPDANTVIGTSWYDQKETPGLGAEISTKEWQNQFSGKQVFMPGPDGTVNFTTSPLGINVVKGEAHAHNAVDGIPGATVTSTGVAEAYRQSLSPYRSFLIKAHNAYKGKNGQ
jgi:Na+-transporting NADH:ubiquinone oxidoreductase subunit C